MNLFKTGKLHNEGFTMVELIIAIAIGAIISGAVAAFMTFSIRNYRDQSVNADMQFELQTNLNQMMDEIMASSGMVIVQNSGTPLVDEPHTKYAVFGNFNTDVVDNSSGSPVTGKGFRGVILIAGQKDSDGRFNIYMNRIEKIMSGTPNDMATTIYNDIKDKVDETNSAYLDPNPYLLGMNATVFDLTPDPNNVWLNTPTPSPTPAVAPDKEYVNPLAVKVELQFAKDATSHTVTKRVEDIAYMRNKATGSIFIDGVEYKLKKKE